MSQHLLKRSCEGVCVAASSGGQAQEGRPPDGTGPPSSDGDSDSPPEAVTSGSGARGGAGPGTSVAEARCAPRSGRGGRLATCSIGRAASEPRGLSPGASQFREKHTVVCTPHGHRGLIPKGTPPSTPTRTLAASEHGAVLVKVRGTGSPPPLPYLSRRIQVLHAQP